MPKPQIAVIVPHYEDVARLARCLEALSPQLGPDVEAVVVDNGSTADLEPIRRAHPGIPVVTLATAHPSKFPDAVAAATGIRPGLPQRLGDLMMQEERYICLPDEYDAVCDYLRDRVQG